MTIASEIQRIKTNIANAYDALENKGATMPATEDSANLASTVNTVSTGGTIESLSITPSTSAQTITATGGVDGYSPINVSAVTSSIDANITAGNIKDGISILGVTGTLTSGDEITATNTTGAAISADDRVWVNGEDVYTQNFTIAGSPTIDSTTKVMSNLSYDNYIYFPNPNYRGYSTLEINSKFRYSASVGEFRIFEGDTNTFKITILGNENKISVYLATNIGAWAIIGKGSTTLVEDTVYYVKLRYDGSAFQLLLSTDGTTWNTDYNNITDIVLRYGGGNGVIGQANVSNSSEIYLLETNIKKDGNIIWAPYTKTSTNYSIINDTDITSTSFTGVAQEAIANNTSGIVMTLLDGNGTYAPTTATKSITTNGTYTASAENAYGLSEVTVDVPTPDVWCNWKTDVTINSSSATWNISGNSYHGNLVCGNGMYLLFSGNSDDVYSYTTDNGVNWTSSTLLDSAPRWVGGFGNNMFVAVGRNSSKVAYSSDGINWSSATLPSSGGWSNPAYGNGVWVTVKENSTEVAYSIDNGTTWSSTNIGSTAYNWNAVAYGNGLFVAVASSTKTYATSSDGSTWVTHTFTTQRNRQAIGFAGGLFISPGYNDNKGEYSSDGINWTTFTLPGTLYWSDVSGNDSCVFISSDTQFDNILAYSLDRCETWNSKTFSYTPVSRLAYDGEKIVYMSAYTTANYYTISQSQCYTLTASPTTSTQVYEIPKKTSALTITAVGTGTITLSDSKVYNRNSAGDVQSPVLGTKTITSNDTYTAASDYLDGFSSVTVDVPSAPTKKYNLLDRVKDDSNNEIGTVSGFFTDANNVEYAVVCLDAQYRLAQGTWCSNESAIVTDLPTYGSSSWGPWEAKETATFNTQKILDYCTAGSYTSTACSHCRSKSFTIDGTTYYGQLPNMIELNDIIRNHTAINTADTTASSYSSLNFESSRNPWSSNQYTNNAYAWQAFTYGDMYRQSKSADEFVIPVLEIPNT